MGATCCKADDNQAKPTEENHLNRSHKDNSNIPPKRKMSQENLTIQGFALLLYNSYSFFDPINNCINLFNLEYLSPGYSHEDHHLMRFACKDLAEKSIKPTSLIQMNIGRNPDGTYQLNQTPRIFSAGGVCISSRNPDPESPVRRGTLTTNYFDKLVSKESGKDLSSMSDLNFPCISPINDCIEYKLSVANQNKSKGHKRTHNKCQLAQLRPMMEPKMDNKLISLEKTRFYSIGGGKLNEVYYLYEDNWRTIPSFPFEFNINQPLSICSYRSRYIYLLRGVEGDVKSFYSFDTTNERKPWAKINIKPCEEWIPKDCGAGIQLDEENIIIFGGESQYLDELNSFLYNNKTSKLTTIQNQMIKPSCFVQNAKFVELAGGKKLVVAYGFPPSHFNDYKGCIHVFNVNKTKWKIIDL